MYYSNSVRLKINAFTLISVWNWSLLIYFSKPTAKFTIQDICKTFSIIYRHDSESNNLSINCHSNQMFTTHPTLKINLSREKKNKTSTYIIKVWIQKFLNQLHYKLTLPNSILTFTPTPLLNFIAIRHVCPSSLKQKQNFPAECPYLWVKQLAQLITHFPLSDKQFAIFFSRTGRLHNVVIAKEQIGCWCGSYNGGSIVLFLNSRV